MYPYFGNLLPCEQENNDYTFINISERKGNLKDYLDDYTLIGNNNPPDSTVKVLYHGEDIISYQDYGMISYNCFLLLGSKYQYNICKEGEIDPRNIDTSMLDNIKILK